MFNHPLSALLNESKNCQKYVCNSYTYEYRSPLSIIHWTIISCQWHVQLKTPTTNSNPKHTPQDSSSFSVSFNHSLKTSYSINSASHVDHTKHTWAITDAQLHTISDKLQLGICCPYSLFSKNLYIHMARMYLNFGSQYFHVRIELQEYRWIPDCPKKKK